MFGDDQSASSGVLSIRHEPVVGMKVSVKYEDAHSDEESWHKGTIELAHEMPDGKFKVEVIFPCGYRDSTIVFPSKENDVRLLEDGIDRKKEAGEVLPKGEFHAEYKADLDETITNLEDQRHKKMSESAKAHYSHPVLGDQRRKEQSKRLLACFNDPEKVAERRKLKRQSEEDGTSKPHAKKSKTGRLMWTERFEEFVQWKAERGDDCYDIPMTLQTLRSWVFTQRKQRNAGKLSAERIKKLDDIGFDWGAKHGPRGKKWDKRKTS